MSRKSAVLALPLCLALAGSAPPRGPALVCPEPVFDVGPVRGGRSLTHSFRLRNQGPKPVVIVAVKSSCGCLTPRIDRMRFGPGEEGIVSLEANTLTQPEGRHGWSARVRYREEGAGPGEEHELVVMIRARVRSEVSVRPTSLVLRTTGTVSHPITFRDRRPRPLTITALYTTRSQLKARLGERTTDSAGTEQRIFLDVLPGYPEGHHEETVYLSTNDPDYRDLRVPVTVVKTTPRKVRLAPASLTVQATAGGPALSRLVRLRAAGEPVRIARVEASHPALVCRWAAGPGADCTLKVRIDPTDLRAPGFNAEVTVHLEGDLPPVTLPIRCLVEE